MNNFTNQPKNNKHKRSQYLVMAEVITARYPWCYIRITKPVYLYIYKVGSCHIRPMFQQWVDWKLRTRKWWTIKVAGHKIAGHENDGPNDRTKLQDTKLENQKYSVNTTMKCAVFWLLLFINMQHLDTPSTSDYLFLKDVNEMLHSVSNKSKSQTVTQAIHCCFEVTACIIRATVFCVVSYRSPAISYPAFSASNRRWSTMLTRICQQNLKSDNAVPLVGNYITHKSKETECKLTDPQ